MSSTQLSMLMINELCPLYTWKKATPALRRLLSRIYRLYYTGVLSIIPCFINASSNIVKVANKTSTHQHTLLFCPAETLAGTRLFYMQIVDKCYYLRTNHQLQMWVQITQFGAGKSSTYSCKKGFKLFVFIQNEAVWCRLC